MSQHDCEWARLGRAVADAVIAARASSFAGELVDAQATAVNALLKLRHGEQAPNWNGLCPAGTHGLDFYGQHCDLCYPKAALAENIAKLVECPGLEEFDPTKPFCNRDESIYEAIVIHVHDFTIEKKGCRSSSHCDPDLSKSHHGHDPYKVCTCGLSEPYVKTHCGRCGLMKPGLSLRPGLNDYHCFECGYR